MATWTPRTLKTTASAIGSAAAQGILAAIRDELTQIGNRAGADHRPDLDHVYELVLRLRAADREALRFGGNDA